MNSGLCKGPFEFLPTDAGWSQTILEHFRVARDTPGMRSPEDTISNLRSIAGIWHLGDIQSPPDASSAYGQRGHASSDDQLSSQSTRKVPFVQKSRSKVGANHHGHLACWGNILCSCDANGLLSALLALTHFSGLPPGRR